MEIRKMNFEEIKKLLEQKNKEIRLLTEALVSARGKINGNHT